MCHQRNCCVRSCIWISLLI
uniref:Uncharacterized protein n=1 Tax=Lepeophtheirus salmonis TaxID=72036 RepID=A0A0K2VGH0_LEPSM